MQVGWCVFAWLGDLCKGSGCHPPRPHFSSVVTAWTGYLFKETHSKHARSLKLPLLSLHIKAQKN